MLLHDWKPAANARRVRIFLAEKGIEVATKNVGVPGEPRLDADYLAEEESRVVPVLELDDGTRIGEAMAICRYLELLHPEPPLLGTTPLEQARIDMWERRADIEGLQAVVEHFRNGFPPFEDRGLAGFAEPVAQIPALIDRGRQRIDRFFAKFDKGLADNAFVAGERFSVADITAFCAVDFAKSSKIGIPEERTNMRRWYEEVSARPSAKA